MTLRDLASDLGVKPASLYNHIASKQELLAELLEEYTREMVEGLENALAEAREPTQKLRAFVIYHIGFHTMRIAQASICLTELRHLQGAHRRVVQELRDGYEARLRAIVRDGVEGGVFIVDDVELATYALFGMITSVINWYQPTGRCSPEQIAQSYSNLALSTLGHNTH